ncbi:MAG: TIGR02186 family protein [Pseudomonadota bacterium]
MKLRAQPARRRFAPRLCVLLLAAAAAMRPASVAAAPLIADLSDHLIAITTGFTGTDVLMFGATDGPGDIVVTVRGPLTDVAVRRKERIAGIWVNRESLEFGQVPSYYAMASSRPIADMLDSGMAQRQQVGEDNLALALPDAPAPEVDEFRQALLQAKQEQGLYVTEPGKVSFLGNQLFRTELHFPSNVPVGSYLVEVLLVRDGKVVSAQTTPLIISKIGLGAAIYQFAHTQSLAYGAIAVLIALLAGWIGYLAFRRI